MPLSQQDKVSTKMELIAIIIAKTNNVTADQILDTVIPLADWVLLENHKQHLNTDDKE